MKTLENGKPVVVVKTIVPGAERRKAAEEQAKKAMANVTPDGLLIRHPGDRGRS
jgi:hypothetical protein